MFKIGIFLILHGLILGIQCLPKQHHVIGRSGVQTRPNRMQNDLKTNHHHNREPRNIHLLKLKDPLDCLSQVVCGLNTYPPQKPSVRTSTANDFAFLLKNSIAKLRSQKQATTTTTTTTTPPSTKRSTTKAPLNDEDEDYDSESVENDVDYEAEEVEEYYDAPPPIDRRSGYHRMKRYSIFNKRRGEEPSKKNKKQSKKNGKPGKRSKVKLRTSPYDQYFKRVPSNKPGIRPLTPLERLRMETDLRAKLLSFAQCPDVGLIDHSCPFNYQQMLVLISSSLERERTISYTANKVLPMVGYLIKSRNYTGTLQSTFTAIERINNYTIDNDREGKPIDFTHILDEVMNRVTGDAGLRIVDTSNDSASASVWEDDEFDHVLQNPYERRRPQSDNYKLDKKRKEAELKRKQKEKLSAKQADDQSTTSEEDTSEEGLIFDRPRQRPRPPNGSGGDGESSSEEEEEDEQVVNKVLLEAKRKEEEKKKKEEERKQKMQIKVTTVKKSILPLPVFGHLQKSAEDE